MPYSALEIAASEGNLAEVDRILAAERPASVARKFTALFSAKRKSPEVLALKIALHKCNSAIVNRLLQVPQVTAYVAANPLSVIRDSLHTIYNDSPQFHSKAGIIKKLLQIPAVASYVNNKTAEVLSYFDHNHDNFDARTAINIVVLLQSPAVLQAVAEETTGRLMSLVIEGNNLELVERMLGTRTIENQAANNGNALLSTAIANCDLPIVERLLKIHKVLQKATADENNALETAQRRQRVDVIEFLLQIPEIQTNNDEIVARARDFLFDPKAWSVESVWPGHAELFARLVNNKPQIANAMSTEHQRIMTEAMHDRNRHNRVNLKAIENLLKIPQVSAWVAERNQEFLCEVIRRRDLKALNCFLQNPDVLNNITADNNAALQIAVNQGGIDVVNRLLEIEVVRNANDAAVRAAREFIAAYNQMERELDAPQQARTATAINTHTASIHDSVSMSAKELKKRYEHIKFDNKKQLANLKQVYTDNIQELRASIVAVAPERSSISDEDTQNTIAAAIEYVMAEKRTDPQSNISLQQLFKLLLAGISQIESAETKKDAYLRLCTSLYLMQTEYGLEINRANQSCMPGFFNDLIYSQQTTLPNEVQIVVHVKTDASAAMNIKMRNFAQQLLQANAFTSAEEFETKTLEKAQADNAKVCKNLIRDIVEEFYKLFEYPTSAAAKKATDSDIDKHCQEFFGCKPEELFDSIDFEEIYNSSNRPKSTPSL